MPVCSHYLVLDTKSQVVDTLQGMSDNHSATHAGPLSATDTTPDEVTIVLDGRSTTARTTRGDTLLQTARMAGLQRAVVV